MEQTYFRKGFGLKDAIQGSLTEDYHSGIVDEVKSRGLERSGGKIVPVRRMSPIYAAPPRHGTTADMIEVEKSRLVKPSELIASTMASCTASTRMVGSAECR